MTNKEYHAHPAISKSGLDLLARSPYHYKNKHLFKQKTKAMIIGSALHKLALEPDDFESEFLVCDASTRNTKKYKKMELEAGDKDILLEKEYEDIKGMAGSMLKSGYLVRGVKEQSYFSKLKDVAVKCRPDCYIEDLGVIIDLKTTNDASRDAMIKKIAEFSYHIQASFYMDVLKSLGKKADMFWFVFVEKTPPYLINSCSLGDEELTEGKDRYLELLDIYKKCEKTNNWHGYEENNWNLSLPRYSFKYKKGV